MHHTPERFKDGSTEQDIDNVIHDQSQHQAFVAYTEDPNTFAEAMASPYLKEWEKALYDEIKQLETTGMIK